MAKKTAKKGKTRKSAKSASIAKSSPSNGNSAQVSLRRIEKDRKQRRHRQVIYLNDEEWAAVRLYTDKFKVKSRSALFRESVLMRIVSVLDDCQPTLF
ncbi:MAG: hypothetical protein ACI39U_09530 [Candidatus Cryptobacteroides sp.]